MKRVEHRARVGVLVPHHARLADRQLLLHRLGELELRELRVVDPDRDLDDARIPAVGLQTLAHVLRGRAIGRRSGHMRLLGEDAQVAAQRVGAHERGHRRLARELGVRARRVEPGEPDGRQSATRAGRGEVGLCERAGCDQGESNECDEQAEWAIHRGSPRGSTGDDSESSRIGHGLRGSMGIPPTPPAPAPPPRDWFFAPPPPRRTHPPRSR